MVSRRSGRAQAQLRETNLATILRHLQKEAPLSRAQLAGMTELNKSTVSSLSEELVGLGLIHESGLNSSGGGRPATMLELNPQAGQVIGVELGVDAILAILADITGRILWRRSLAIEPGYEQNSIINNTLSLVDEAIAVNQIHGKRLFGLGITLPGMVDVERGLLVFSPNLQWRGVELKATLHNHTNLPIFVENDANAAAMGEHIFGVARQVRSFIFIVASVGVGGGLFLDGSLYRGAGGLAGEIGHTNFNGESTRPCRCGNRGCWENSGNESSLYHRVNALLDVGRESIIPNMMDQQHSPLTLAIINQAAGAGDAVAQEALAETGTALGIGISNLINIFNPEMIVLGGTMSAAGDHLLPAINRMVSKYTLSDARRQTQLSISAFGTDAIVMGAVALVVEAVLSKPTSVDRIERLFQPKYELKEV